jgi:putative transposase
MSIPGQIYLLTTTTRLRRRVFADTVSARAVSRVIHAASTWGIAQLLAWVLMPDHWHGLLQLGDESLGRVMNRFKANASRVLHASGEMEGSPWERSFHDHALRCGEDVRKVARYIVANPIRSGLADNVLGYPYWNAVWLEHDVPTVLL